MATVTGAACDSCDGDWVQILWVTYESCKFVVLCCFVVVVVVGGGGGGGERNRREMQPAICALKSAPGWRSLPPQRPRRTTVPAAIPVEILPGKSCG